MFSQNLTLTEPWKYTPEAPAASATPSPTGTVSGFIQQTILPLASQYLQLTQIKKTQQAYADAAKAAAAGNAIIQTMPPMTAVQAAPVPQTSQIPWTWIIIGGVGLLGTVLLMRK